MTSSRADAAVADDFLLLVDVLPEGLREGVRALAVSGVLEVVLDLGRAPEARLVDRVVRLREALVGPEDLQQVLERVGAPGEDNRAGIERTLHRVSAIRNRRGRVVGLTLRVGRAVYGTIDMLKDLIGSGRNLLLLGRPGVGKTTKLREVARVLADDLGKRVMVVDTSNEIGGDGDVPHPGIGGARRMQVSRPDRQHDVMIEAVENHMPEAIIVDEIGTSAEASAARTIAERGVQLVATAHGNTLENLVLNPTLSDLVGGVHTVTLSDDEARRRRTQKTVSERKAPPTFDIVVEMVSRDEVRVHADTADAVDRLLAGKDVGGERRRQDAVTGRVEVEPAKALPPVALGRGPMVRRPVGTGSGVERSAARAVPMGVTRPAGEGGALRESSARQPSETGVSQTVGTEESSHADDTRRSERLVGEDDEASLDDEEVTAAHAETEQSAAPPTLLTEADAERHTRAGISTLGIGLPESRAATGAAMLPASRPTRFAPRRADDSPDAWPAEEPKGLTRLYPHGVNRDLLLRVLRELPVEVRLVSRLESADLVVTLRSRANDPRMRRVVAKTGARVEAVKRASSTELRRALKGFFNVLEGVDEEEVRDAIAEAEHAVKRALGEGISVALSPRQSRVRKLQHRLVSRYPLEAVSHGSEPSRHLVIYPLGAEVEAALAKEDHEGSP
ncbi:R3H domain-containing nucleic acid-binding protein [Myxococcus sp. CA051A]|uniref:R3H domain-containing nucleic acid-binding protein n=1 Tax=Myxococcus sp. CA051A TaxID=2741739 RepID=UPI0027383D6E|nr:R3H domain-containing nucleic acid-binding protein [Myxococcus sp. CA051A]